MDIFSYTLRVASRKHINFAHAHTQQKVRNGCYQHLLENGIQRVKIWYTNSSVCDIPIQAGRSRLG